MNPQVARRYAAATFAVAKKQNSVQEVQEDLDAIVALMKAREDLKEVYESPKIDRQRKLDLIERLFSDRARPITLRLLRLLIQKRREEELFLIRDAYQRIREEDAGILRITIRTALPLDGELEQRIVKRIAEQTGMTILHTTEVDPNLIGGVAVQYGDFVLDGSIRGHLKRLQERLYYDILKQG
ncbi:MAG: ATP synthase subunit delta [Fimbriimonadales bacterium]|nr:MAG: ATP synthase subunit delta [Fimbriimonadales bacterium]